jgi:hypothetical protein
MGICKSVDGDGEMCSQDEERDMVSSGVGSEENVDTVTP